MLTNLTSQEKWTNGRKKSEHFTGTEKKKKNNLTKCNP